MYSEKDLYAVKNKLRSYYEKWLFIKKDTLYTLIDAESMINELIGLRMNVKTLNQEIITKDETIKSISEVNKKLKEKIEKINLIAQLEKETE